MKKIITWVLLLACILGLAACGSRNMRYIIEYKPRVSRVMEKFHDNFIRISTETSGYPNGANCEVSLDVENIDSYTDLSIGDEVVLYYDGNIAESDPHKSK